MRLTLLFVLFLASAASADLFLDDFADGEQGWQGWQPVVVGGGGAGGPDDPYLLVTSNSNGSGPGSRLAVYNEQSRWTGVGPLFVADVLYGEDTTLEMRLVLIAGDGTRWTSTNAAPVTANDDWQTIALDPLDMTRVAGTASLDETLATLSRTLLRHDAGAPSSGGTPIATGVGLDNLGYVVVPEPSTLLPALAAGLLLARRR